MGPLSCRYSCRPLWCGDRKVPHRGTTIVIVSNVLHTWQKTQCHFHTISTVYCLCVCQIRSEHNEEHIPTLRYNKERMLSGSAPNDDDGFIQNRTNRREMIVHFKQQSPEKNNKHYQFRRSAPHFYVLSVSYTFDVIINSFKFLAIPPSTYIFNRVSQPKPKNCPDGFKLHLVPLLTLEHFWFNI